MSPTVRAGLIFGLAAVVLFAVLSIVPIPCLNFVGVIGIGLAAGYFANRWSNSTADRRLGRGAAAGAIAGAITLIGSVVATMVLINTPTFQSQIGPVLAQIQQNPEGTSISPEDLQAGLAGIAVFAGGCLGLINLLLMVIAGLLGSLFWKGAATADYVPAGGSAAYNQPPAGGYIPQSDQPAGGAQQYNAPTQGMTPGDQDPGEGGARVYDPNDPNRPPS